MKRKFLITALCAALLFAGCSEREAALYTSGEDGGTYSSVSSDAAEGSETTGGESSAGTSSTSITSSTSTTSSTSNTSSTGKQSSSSGSGAGSSSSSSSKQSSSSTSSKQSSSSSSSKQSSSSSSSKQSSSSTSSKQSSSSSSSKQSSSSASTKQSSSSTSAKQSSSSSSSKQSSSKSSSTSSKPETVTPERIGAYDQRRQTAEEKAFCDEVFDLVNEQRAKNGLEPFKKMDKLTEVAVARAWENTVVYGHTRPDGASCFTILKENGLNYRACAENVAAGYTTPAAVVNGWMNSSGHRANILDPNLEYLGVGFYRENGGWGGYGYYWAQVFYTPL